MVNEFLFSRSKYFLIINNNTQIFLVKIKWHVDVWVYLILDIIRIWQSDKSVSRYRNFILQKFL